MTTLEYSDLRRKNIQRLTRFLEREAVLSKDIIAAMLYNADTDFEIIEFSFTR